jgi:hypothetical protein
MSVLRKICFSLKEECEEFFCWEIVLNVHRQTEDETGVKEYFPCGI